MPRGTTSDLQELTRGIFAELERMFRGQAEIAQLLGINQSTVSKARATGKTSLQVVLSAARLAGRPPEEVFRIAGVSQTQSAFPVDDPPAGTFLMRVDRLPGLRRWIEVNPTAYRVSEIARGMAIYDELAATPASAEDGSPLHGWGTYFRDALAGKLKGPKKRGDQATAEALERGQLGGSRPPKAHEPT